jgi:hypothetical protein
MLHMSCITMPHPDGMCKHCSGRYRVAAWPTAAFESGVLHGVDAVICQEVLCVGHDLNPFKCGFSSSTSSTESRRFDCC